MKRPLTCCLVVIFALFTQGALAQPIPPGASPYLPPPPPPPPPPKIEVPTIPKMDELPKRSYAPIAPQKSFGERVTKCLDDAAASGLGPQRARHLFAQLRHALNYASDNASACASGTTSWL